MRALRQISLPSQVRTTFVMGVHLLALCEQRVACVPGEAPAGAGTRDDPYRPVGPMQFLWCARDAKQSKKAEKFYAIGRRVIHKSSNHYISDIGPYEEGPLTDFTVKEPKYPQVSSVFRDVEAIQVPNLQALFSSPSIASLIRDAVDGEFDAAHLQAVSSGDPTIGRLGDQLPTIVAAMLIAEPARNIRAWPINLMILDLMRNGVWRFGWSDIFWHRQDRVSGGDIQEFGPKSATDRTFTVITNAMDLHLIGGQMPASPTEGGKRGGVSLLANQAGTKIAGGVKYDYIHHKEIEVVIDWLRTQPGVAAHWAVETGFEDKMYSEKDKLADKSKVLLVPSQVLAAQLPAVAVIQRALDGAVRGA